MTTNRLKAIKTELANHADDYCECGEAFGTHDYDNDCDGDTLHLAACMVEDVLEDDR